MTTKCPKCHSENPDTLKFCGECGAQLIASSRDIQPEVAETLQTAIRELTTGSTFAGRYQIIEELGKGRMGRVLAFDPDSATDNRLVNILNQRKARWLLDHLDKFFLLAENEGARAAERRSG